jgi:hypothetical protein
VDFWAQHKDFILKVLAGFGVFLVALIARGIVYGDELEAEQSRNRRLAGQIRSRKIVAKKTVASLNRAAEALQANVNNLAAEIGFDASDEKALRLELLTRIARYIHEIRGGIGDSPEVMAARVQQNFDVNLNGTFGALRLLMRDEILDEAGERNVAVPEEGLGFQSLVSIESGDLLKYLLQLELVTRVVSDAMGMEVRTATGQRETISVEAIGEVRIDTADQTPHPLGSGVNPQFLREYEVRITLRGSEQSIINLVNRLESGTPSVPVRTLRAERRPRDQIEIEMRLLAVATNTSVEFEAAKETDQ